MTLLDSYFPFDQGLGATATPANWRQMARLWYGSGVVPGNGAQFAATIAASIVTIQPGAAWVDGFYGATTVNKTVSSLGLGSGLVAARMDLNARTITFVYLPGGSPTVNPPNFSQNPLVSTYDIPLWYVTSATAITDVRQYSLSNASSLVVGPFSGPAATATGSSLTLITWTAPVLAGHTYEVYWDGYGTAGASNSPIGYLYLSSNDGAFNVTRAGPGGVVAGYEFAASRSVTYRPTTNHTTTFTIGWLSSNAVTFGANAATAKLFRVA